MRMDITALQVARVALELLHAVEQAVMQHRIQRGRGLRQHGLGNDQLAHQVDDLVDFLHADADGSRFLVRVRGRRAGGARRLGDGFGSGGRLGHGGRGRSRRDSSRRRRLGLRLRGELLGRLRELLDRAAGADAPGAASRAMFS